MSVARELDAALHGLTPTLPLELADCEAVRGLVLARLPGCAVEVFHDTRNIIVRVHGTPRLERKLKAVP